MKKFKVLCMLAGLSSVVMASDVPNPTTEVVVDIKGSTSEVVVSKIKISTNDGCYGSREVMLFAEQYNLVDQVEFCYAGFDKNGDSLINMNGQRVTDLQSPYLIDSNTGIETIGSENIIKYLVEKFKIEIIVLPVDLQL